MKQQLLEILHVAREADGRLLDLYLIREMIPLNELTPESDLPTEAEQDRYYQTKNGRRVQLIGPGRFLVGKSIYTVTGQDATD